jgi:hypothetical protein
MIVAWSTFGPHPIGNPTDFSGLCVASFAQVTEAILETGPGAEP